jgi:cell division protein FtsL
MNTATRVIAQSRAHTSLPALSFITRPRLINVILLLMLILSAFGIIYIKDLNRRLFIQYQTLQISHDKLYEDWGKLLLEQSTWSTQSRVRKIATSRLDMNLPASKEIVVLKAHS